jgi:aminoglycoside phosphotransferase (APT) family kinase protein
MSEHTFGDDPPTALPGETVDAYVARASRATRPAGKTNSKEQKLQLIKSLADVLSAAADGEDAVEAAYSKISAIKGELSNDDKRRIYSLLVPALFNFIATASARRHELEKRVAALEQREANGGQAT